MGQVLPAGEVRCLVFEARGERFALDIAAVAGLVQRRKVIPVPLAPAFIEGVINLRGNILTVISLPRLLDLPEGGRPPQVQVVLRLPEMPLAVEADELIGIESLDPLALAERSLSEGSGPPGIRIVSQHRGHPLHFLDTQALLSYIDACDFQGTGVTAASGRS